MTYAEIVAARTAARTAAAAIMDRARQPEDLHAAALAYRASIVAVAAAGTACSDKCDTRDADGVCEAHRRPVRGCVGHRHNRK